MCQRVFSYYVSIGHNIKDSDGKDKPSPGKTHFLQRGKQSSSSVSGLGMVRFQAFVREARESGWLVHSPELIQCGDPLSLSLKIEGAVPIGVVWPLAKQQPG